MTFVLVQEPWKPAEAVSTIGDVIAAALETVGQDGPHIVLLPQGQEDKGEAPPVETELVEQLCVHSKTHEIYLAGSAIMLSKPGSMPRHLGFICGPDGTCLLRAVKSSPDLVAGFSDTASALNEPVDFDVAHTPVGTLGMVLGEDILFPHIVRSAALKGAEIILNPCREAGDDLFEARQNARQARAYENVTYLACTSPLSSKANGFVTTLPTASGMYNPQGMNKLAKGGETFFNTEVDMDWLRRKRQNPRINFLAIFRNRLYAPGYETSPTVNKSSPTTRKDWWAEGNARVAARAHDPGLIKNQIDQYDVLLVQTAVRNVTDLEHRDEVIQKNIDESLRIASGAAAPNVKLVVFPEYWTQGVAFGRSIEDWTKVAVRVDGPEVEQLCRFAQEKNTYLAGGIFEFDPKWPHRWFNTAIIIDDQGNLIHRYRKIQCADLVGMLPDTTPGNLYSAYVEEYGYDGLFPVADTPIGKLATVICFDMNFPETSRALVNRGAEVLIHPTAEPYATHRRCWDLAKMTRAFENTAYLLSCSEGGEFAGNNSYPGTFHRGHSKVINYDGTVAGVVDGPGETWLRVPLDLAALRTARANPRANLAAWDDSVVYGHVYREHDGFPNDVWLETPMESASEGVAEVKKVVDRYTASGVFVSPSSSAPTP